MTTRHRSGAVLLATALALAASVATAADSQRVLTVLTVKVKGDQDAYLAQLRKFMAGVRRLDTGGTTRVWRGTLAGGDTGMLFIATEYPNSEAWARGSAKVQADEDLRKLRRELEKSGMREIVSNSMFDDVTP